LAISVELVFLIKLKIRYFDPLTDYGMARGVWYHGIYAGRSGMPQKLKNCENFSFFVKVSIISISTLVDFGEFLNNRRTDGICAGAMPFPRNFLII